MADFDPRLYGARWAEHYDEWHAGLADDERAVTVLAELAADSPVLEFGVGTGRLAVPLAERHGIEVVGVDISEEMLAKLREKSTAVTIVAGDMVTVRLQREFEVAFIAFNSIFALGTQREQVGLFRNAAAHLRPGGRFVLETAVTSNSGGQQNQLRTVKVEDDRLTLAAGIVDPVTAVHTGTWVVLEPTRTSFYPLHGRQVTHHEMDLMAELAGLELEHRWGDWQRGPFDANSRLHVSVYRKPRSE